MNICIYPSLLMASMLPSSNTFDHRFNELGLTRRKVMSGSISSIATTDYESRYRREVGQGHGHVFLGARQSEPEVKSLFARYMHGTSVAPKYASPSGIPIGLAVASTSLNGTAFVVARLENSVSYVAIYNLPANPNHPGFIHVGAEVEYTCRRALGEHVGLKLQPRTTVRVGSSNLTAMTYTDGATYVRVNDWMQVRAAQNTEASWHGSIVNTRVNGKQLKIAGAAKGMQVDGVWKPLSNPVLYRDGVWWAPLAGFQALVP